MTTAVSLWMAMSFVGSATLLEPRPELKMDLLPHHRSIPHRGPPTEASPCLHPPCIPNPSLVSQVP
ncbi:zyxin, isoform CRA_b [Rattus norvegicus]|uniref:Zyxin, isoform CRA_b n=1 Tax=Rattus norvegicus TaxID=10116 RepID=A6IF75_RAT|nr:zyxin, isoform CRA_b [Rattus norvegicus]